MFTLILLAINFATVVAGAVGEQQPGSGDVQDFIPCC